MAEDNMLVFGGFDGPEQNWSRLPHQLIAALPLIDSLAELKVVLYVLRHTWGYHDADKRITLGEFTHGRRRRDGTRLDGGVGMCESAVKDGIRRALADGFITRAPDGRSDGLQSWCYALAMRQETAEVVRGGDFPPQGGMEITPPKIERPPVKETTTAGDGAVAAVPAQPLPPAGKEADGWEALGKVRPGAAVRADPLRPDTVATRELFSRRLANSTAKGRSAVSRFTTIEQRDMYLRAVETLGDGWMDLLEKAFVVCGNNLSGIVTYMDGCAKRVRNGTAPTGAVAGGGGSGNPGVTLTVEERERYARFVAAHKE